MSLSDEKSVFPQFECEVGHRRTLPWFQNYGILSIFDKKTFSLVDFLEQIEFF